MGAGPGGCDGQGADRVSMTGQIELAKLAKVPDEKKEVSVLPFVLCGTSTGSYLLGCETLEGHSQLAQWGLRAPRRSGTTGHSHRRGD